jgi:septal ring factor EnvC (AmiA/AmiB activator)
LLDFNVIDMAQEKPHFLESELDNQLASLHQRLETTTAHRKQLEARVNRLRSQLRTEEGRLGQERERESALLTAVRMAKLARNLASGAHLDQQAINTLLHYDQDGDADWHAMTIAQACRAILRTNANRPMSNKELRAVLSTKDKQVSPGSIATTLERYPNTFAKSKVGNVSYWRLVEDPT